MNYVIRKDYYMGQSIQDRQPLKYHIKFFEGSLPQISLGPICLLSDINGWRLKLYLYRKWPTVKGAYLKTKDIGRALVWTGDFIGPGRLLKITATKKAKSVSQVEIFSKFHFKY